MIKNTISRISLNEDAVMDEERDPVIQEAADILGIEYNDFLYKTAVR